MRGPENPAGWTVSGAEAVLTLRAVISNGDFPQYWTVHSHRGGARGRLRARGQVGIEVAGQQCLSSVVLVQEEGRGR